MKNIIKMINGKLNGIKNEISIVINELGLLVGFGSVNKVRVTRCKRSPVEVLDSFFDTLLFSIVFICMPLAASGIAAVVGLCWLLDHHTLYGIVLVAVLVYFYRRLMRNGTEVSPAFTYVDVVRLTAEEFASILESNSVETRRYGYLRINKNDIGQSGGPGYGR